MDEMGKAWTYEPFVPVKTLNPAPYNPREMSDEDINSLCRSIERFGMVEPVVVNRRGNVVVGGHQRLRALIRLGRDSAPVVWVDLGPSDEKLLNLALNRIHGRFDLEKLDVLIAELHGMPDVDVSLSGFSEAEVSLSLDRLVEDQGDEFDEEKAYGEVVEPETKDGDLLQLGPHRLLCGDATDPNALQRLLMKRRVDMIWTDPPYNVDYHSRGKLGGIKNDDMTEQDFKKFCDGFASQMRAALKPGGVYYVCSGWSSWGPFYEAFRRNGLPVSGCIMWDKGSPSMGWSDYRFQHEQVFVGFRPEEVDGRDPFDWIIYGHDDRARHYFRDTRSASDVWRVPRKARQSYLHPTEKPVGLIQNALMNSSVRDNLILDLFAGSGSLLEACHRYQRVAYMIEMDRKWCDVIRKRWEHLTVGPSGDSGSKVVNLEEGSKDG